MSTNPILDVAVQGLAAVETVLEGGGQIYTPALTAFNAGLRAQISGGAMPSVDNFQAFSNLAEMFALVPSTSTEDTTPSASAGAEVSPAPATPTPVADAASTAEASAETSSTSTEASATTPAADATPSAAPSSEATD